MTSPGPPEPLTVSQWGSLLLHAAWGFIRMPLLGATLLSVGGYALTGWLQVLALYRAMAPAWLASDAAVFTVGSLLLHETLYFGMNGFFMYCDRTGLLSQYKLPREPRMQPKPELIRRTIIESLIGHFIAQPPTLWLSWFLLARYGSTIDGPLPPWWTTFWQLVLASVWIDGSFFWTHRALHSRLLYKWCHKQHHEYVGTIGFAAEYSHWFETLFSAQLPTLVVPVLCGFHVLTWWVWLAWRLFETYEGHSGYAFPWLHADVTVYHDFHHTMNKGNYSGSPFWDSLCGTNGPWMRLYKAGKTWGQPNHSTTTKTRIQ